jgi:thioredoxin reductase
VNGRNLIVIGAGPAGLAAALGAVRRGLDVTVLEQGEVGASIRRWGPTRFFSPLAMNLPPGAAEVLAEKLPPDDAILTGPEFVDAVLSPLANCAALAGRVRTNHRVLAVGRTGFTRCDYPGHPIRSERGFRLLVETPDGEVWLEADAVMDASGVYGSPVAIGAGGVPAPGERALAGRLIRDLGKLEDRVDALAGKKVLLIGHGHSAANAIVRLAELAAESPRTRVVWATRSLNRRPCVEVASDPLPERSQIVARANAMAAQPPAWLQVERRAPVESIIEEGRALRVRVGGGRNVTVDEIVGLTGYRPDLSFLSELALAISPVTEGSARLAQALANVTDCLSAPAVSVDDLESGESGFYFAGAKSYGRARTFLLSNGYQQIKEILSGLQGVDPMLRA